MKVRQDKHFIEVSEIHGESKGECEAVGMALHDWLYRKERKKK